MKLSLNELRERFTQEDILLECTTTIPVEISIVHPRVYVQGHQGKLTLEINPGCLVSLTMPPGVTADVPPFPGGERQMSCNLQYLGAEINNQIVAFEDAMRALSIDADAKIWTVRDAP
jgi:hypothetical protein